ncbi:hypothetical protein TWF730_010269 [Orbilia blumenaviensis]|uniref:Uncharacterized protein n=1 Tax=Orbilia blumenaviensis TaxID=1796055 RepID=A0AAV9UQA3_9PEZI
MSEHSQDSDTASQRTTHSSTVNVDNSPDNRNLRLQSPEQIHISPEPATFMPAEPIHCSQPMTLPDLDAAYETVTIPEPAVILYSPPPTEAASIRSIRPPSTLYFCRYSEDGTRSEIGSQLGRETPGIQGFRVFREQDFAGNNRFNIVSPSVGDNSEEDGSENGSSPALTITPGRGEDARDEFEKEAMRSTETVIRYPERRVSLFREILTSESEYEESAVEEAPVTVKELPGSDRFLYHHTPWILRFIYTFIFANWWTLIPLMKVPSDGFHPENLPILYSCAMLAMVITNLCLQFNYFRLYGPPWGQRRRAEKIQDAAEFQEIKERSRRLDLPFGVFVGRNDPGPCPGTDLESNRVVSRATLKKDRNRRKWRMRTGMESYVFTVDMILFILTLAILAVSIVFARHGALAHDAQIMEAAKNGTLATGTLANGVSAGGGGGGPNPGVQLYGDDSGYKAFRLTF